MHHVKVAITGAAGQIGYALLFRIASGQMFGPHVTLDLHLLELPQALPALNGVRMELEDGAFPLLKNVVCTDDVNVAMKETNWALLVGAVPRKAGMARGDLLKINGKIFGPQGQAIQKNAAGDVHVLVIGNPCNTNCLIAMNNAKDIPQNRFYAMTMLDQKRAMAQLAQKSKVAISDIKGMIIWGNHSATQFPDFYHAQINGKPTTEVIQDESWLQQDFIQIVQQRGAEVIKARGASSAASAANAIIETVYHLTHDTPENDAFSVCQCSQGEYNVEPGLIYSFPSRTKDNKTIVVADLQHNEFAQEKLNLTLAELQKEKELIQQLKFI